MNSEPRAWRGLRRLLPTRVPVSHPGDEVSYLTQPFVCGAVGRIDEARLARLRADAPTELIEVYRSHTTVLLASAEVQTWHSGDDRGYYWGSVADGGDPTSWQSASERKVAAGLVVTPVSTILHADPTGLQDLYTRQIDDAVYFSIRIDPLLRLDKAKLHIDWTAWASILAFTCPLADATPFVEVRRVVAAGAVVADDRGFHRTTFEPSWLSADPSDPPTAAEVMATIDASIPEAAERIMPISGGWDSRLLAILGRDHTDQLVGWTTSEDDGRDRDLQLAPVVAEALGIEHRLVVPDTRAWLDELSPARRRLDLQSSLHTWMMSLARVLHEEQPGQRILDGLTGDVLLKINRFFTPELAAADDVNERHRILSVNLSQNRLADHSRFAPGIVDEFRTLSRESLVETVSPFDGHPAEGTLWVLHTRTSRGIASMPMRLLAPELHMEMPFLHPDLISLALRVPHEDKVGGAFYRQVLTAADPSVAGLPSSNDARPSGRRGRKRQERLRTLRAMARTIRGTETVERLLDGELRQALVDEEVLVRLGRTIRGHRQLNWASLFAEWLNTYSDVLADDGPA